jgi:hypothetical protein
MRSLLIPVGTLVLIDEITGSLSLLWSIYHSGERSGALDSKIL